MKDRSRQVVIVGAMLCLTVGSGWSADSPSAREIMEMVEARDDGDNSSSDMEMVLIDRRGGKRVRRIVSYAKDSGDDTLTAMFFTYPPDVAGTGFLTFSYDESGRDDDQWLYLPALRKTKRIAGGSKSGSFMGSDFNYSDLASRDLDDFDYTLVKETEVNGAMTWVIESIPKPETDSEYSRVVTWVTQDNYIPDKVEFFDKKGRLFKVMNVEKIGPVGEEILPLHFVMENVQKKHKTEIIMNEIKLDVPIADREFTHRAIQR